MDDDYKEYKRNKPQQKIYKPGSGPLRRSCYGFDSKMNSHDDMGRRGGHQNHYGSQNSVNEVSDGNRDHAASSMRQKKPEQQLYVAKSNDCTPNADRQSKGSMRSDNSSQFNNRRMSNNPDKSAYNSSSYSRGALRRDRNYGDTSHKERPSNDGNYNRNYRQASETRSISPTRKDQNSLDRNRDSRSMETSGGRHMAGSGGKPPSGRRNSAGYMSDTSRPRHMVNIDNIPPRFRKKFLEQSGYYSSENVDQLHRDKHMSNPSIPPMSNQDQHYNSGPNWSQTLPSRGRGRLRDTESFDREKFMNTYLRNYENSRRSTPSSSYMNLYDPHSIEYSQSHEKTDPMVSSMESQKEISESASLNGISMKTNTASSNQIGSQKESDNDHDSETTSQISSTLLDVTNLDWTEEVEKNIKLDDLCDSTISFSQNTKPSKSEEIKPAENRESKRSGRPRRKDRRSSSRSLKNVEKKSERNRKDSTASVQPENERNRKDSNASIPYESISISMKNRERRDSHRSNRSSTIGNSRDDLDRWRSLRSYSREQSIEGRIVSQCNSRDTSANRAASPRDHDGFRVPNAVTKSTAWLNSNQNKNNSSWASGRTPSIERGRQSPAPSMTSQATEPSAGGGSSRRTRKRSGRRRSRASDALHAPTHAPVPPPPISHHQSSTPMNWREEILESKKQGSHDKPVENTHQRNRLNSVMSDKSTTESSSHHPGIIVLPQGSIPHTQKDLGRGGSTETQKHLYDPQNPSKPIIVQTSPSKIDMRMEQVKESTSRGGLNYEASDAARAAKHRSLLQEVERADAILQTYLITGPVALADHWNDVVKTRQFLQNALQKLLMSDLKYCQADNVEHHFWKILYYNILEVLRKSFSQLTDEDKSKVVKLINIITEEGIVYFENLVHMLEKTYKFSTDEYINDNHALPPKGLGYVGLSLISVQKLYLFLGDLARYKEQVNETNNYAKSKFWYTKAQLINPKNGRPYNQLAILAIYARRKLDSVYYYMRSLMSSNPFHSARESLLTLYEESKRKYESAERKQKAAIETKVSESRVGGSGDSETKVQGNRREVWVRPTGYRSAAQRQDLEQEQLKSMSSVELNKIFIISYLNVHGKIITRIGMETFHECASQMLRRFRALLHRQPLPTPSARLLQLTALNMFSVELSGVSAQNPDGTRSAWLDCALGVSFLMFGAMLERCCALLPAAPHSQQHADALLLLPAIKVWSDWMLWHSSVWNPPPPFENFDTESEHDTWEWLAKLMNLLEALDDKTIELENEMKEAYTCVRLGEDTMLAGFTPLIYMEPGVAWVRSDVPYHAADHALRTRKLLFFGTEYLVGVEPAVLRLEYPADAPPRYVSAVQRAQPVHPPLQNLVLEPEIEDSDEDSASDPRSGPAGLTDAERDAEGADETTKKLLRRKEQLESRKASLEKQRQRMQEMLRSGSISVEIEVRPRWLVPDTNCFIDHLPLLQAVASAPTLPYVLAVPLVVMTELEGLRRCARVGGAAAAALEWVGGAGGGVRLATSRGSLLASRAFTAERDHRGSTNDDKVLATALNLYANLSTANEPDTREDDGVVSKLVRRIREVVLLTDDRNLRVKALAAELPTRDLPSFVQWAGLSRDDATTSKTAASPDDAAAAQ